MCVDNTFVMPCHDVVITCLFSEKGYSDITKVVANGSVTIPASVVREERITDVSKLVLRIVPIEDPPQPNIPKDASAYDITLIYDGRSLAHFSQKITVKINYAVVGKDLRGFDVYYVFQDGKDVDDMGAVYSENGFVFKTDHLSTFVISSVIIEPVKDGGFDHTIMLIVIVVLIILAIIAVIVLRRKKRVE